MKITLTKIFAAVFLFVLAATPLQAQSSASVKMEPAPVSAATNDAVASSNQAEKNSNEAAIQYAQTYNTAAIAAQNQVEISRSLHETVASVVAIIAGCSIPIAFVAIIGLYLFFRHRKNIMLHDTLRAMIDKGTPIPPELLTKPESVQIKRPRNDLRNGLLFIGIGIGVIAVAGKAGWIVFFMGVAFLITALLEKKDKNNDQPPKI